MTGTKDCWQSSASSNCRSLTSSLWTPCDGVELWLASQPQGLSDDTDVIAARLYLADGATRAQRAQRWQRILELHEGSTYEDGGVGVRGGPETVFLLDEAASALVEGLWLASLSMAKLRSPLVAN
jgi:hypothetical protein